MCLFICAICSSYSKSVPVRRPLTIAVSPRCLDEVDDQPLAGFDAQVRQVRRRFLDHRDALLEAEHALLAGVDQHRDHDLVELGGRALEDVDMAEGHRVEGSRGIPRRSWVTTPAGRFRPDAPSTRAAYLECSPLVSIPTLTQPQ